jgi:hypothetical protein
MTAGAYGDLVVPLCLPARVLVADLALGRGFHHPGVAVGVPRQVGEDVPDGPSRQQGGAAGDAVVE